MKKKKLIRITMVKNTCTFRSIKSMANILSKRLIKGLIKQGHTEPILDLKAQEWYIFDEETGRYKSCKKPITKGNRMKKYILTLTAMLFAVSLYAQTGAFATNCPTLEQQQAAYNQSLANGIVVRDTASQQLQCHYSQLATYWNQLHKTKQQDEKTVQQIAKDAQQLAKDKQQLATDAAQGVKSTQLATWELELKAREARIKECEQECDDMYNFCNELKIIIEKPGNDKELADHCKLKINHSGQADGTNPGGTTNNNGGILNPSN